jgi:hypothetical protein
VTDIASIKIVAPIAFWKTKSFWFGWFPAFVTILNVALAELSTGSAGPVSQALFFIIGNVLPVTADDIAEFMIKISPLYALIVAQQRAGLSRPYTVDPVKERLIIEAVEDGKSAFDAGRAIGHAIKGRAR